MECIGNNSLLLPGDELYDRDPTKHLDIREYVGTMGTILERRKGTEKEFYAITAGHVVNYRDMEMKPRDGSNSVVLYQMWPDNTSYDDFDERIRQEVGMIRLDPNNKRHFALYHHRIDMYHFSRDAATVPTGTELDDEKFR